MGHFIYTDTLAKQTCTVNSDDSIEIQELLTGVGATETGSCPCVNGVAFDQVACPVSNEDYCSSCTEQLECRSCGSMDLGKVAEEGLLECIGQRIELGDDVNDLYVSSTLNVVGSMPLHLAVIGKYRTTIAPRYNSIVETLVNEYQANINLADAEGYTPLQIAIQEEIVDMVRLLISLDANVNLRQSTSLVTTLKLAENFAEISLLLTSAGATGWLLFLAPKNLFRKLVLFRLFFSILVTFFRPTLYRDRDLSLPEREWRLRGFVSSYRKWLW